MKIKNILFTAIFLGATCAYPQTLPGLWLGTVEVDKVNEVHSNSTDTSLVTPVKYPFNLQFVFHTDSSGITKLLKEVYIMQSKDKNSVRVLVTDETRLSDFEGIILKGDNKLVAVRFTSPSIDFNPSQNEIALAGSIGNGAGTVISGTDVIQDKNHPTNPFRHQFHPNHKEGITISRSFSITIQAPDSQAATDIGQTRLIALYEETLVGLHKVPLKVSGSMTLTQISSIGKLNPSASGE